MGAVARLRAAAAMALSTRALPSLFAKAYSSYAGGAGFVPPAWWPVGWWQQGYRVPSKQGSAVVEACVSAISQTVASMPLQLWEKQADGGVREVTTGPVVNVLRRPNQYQTRADFVLNLLRNELLEGNGVAIARRQGGNIVSLHPLPQNAATPYIADDGSVFYSIGSKTPLEPEPPLESFFPAGDVLHLRMQTPRHPLIGETPLVAAALSVEAGQAISGHMAAFFKNMTRPSGYLSVPKALRPDVAEKLRQEWERAYSTDNSGRVAVLTDGLDWKPLSVNSVDAQLIQSYNMTTADIARVFRTPLAIIGEPGGATYSTTEALIRHWMSTGLGFVLEHIELALDHLFQLPPNQFTAFDAESLMRSDFPARIDALTKGITGGLFSPNEARAKEGLPAKDYGDEPRLQAQVVPLSFAEKTDDAAAPPAPSTPSAPSATPDAPPDPEEEDEEERAPSAEDVLAKLRSLSHAA